MDIDEEFRILTKKFNWKKVLPLERHFRSVSLKEKLKIIEQLKKGKNK
jgi:hypothetical protein